jgi:hypothetical protein
MKIRLMFIGLMSRPLHRIFEVQDSGAAIYHVSVSLYGIFEFGRSQSEPETFGRDSWDPLSRLARP